MAKKKAGGSTRNNRDSQSKRLGIKVYGGQFVNAGSIIVRQRGNRFWESDSVGIGVDHTLYALKSGIVRFVKSRGRKKVVVEEKVASS